jgi:hypothetical protein
MISISLRVAAACFADSDRLFADRLDKTHRPCRRLCAQPETGMFVRPEPLFLPPPSSLVDGSRSASLPETPRFS